MESSFKNLVEHLQDGVYFTDIHRVISYWNPAAERISGYSSEEVIGKACYADLLRHVDHSGKSLCKGMCPLAHTIRDGEPREAEVFLHHKLGHMVPVWVRTAQVLDENGSVIGGSEIFTDLSPRQAALLRVQELEQLALLDPLTRISNRRHIEDQYAIMAAERDRLGLGVGLILIDLDFFKQVNDTRGHLIGDDVLRAVSETILHSIRSFDLVGRWGGEEFVCLCRNVTEDSLAALAEKIRMLISSMQIPVQNETFSITASIGATLTRKYEYWKTSFQRADTLLLKSKAGGRNQVSIG